MFTTDIYKFVEKIKRKYRTDNPYEIAEICDVDVVIEGVNLWIDDKQPTPWSNYIFVPQAEVNSFFDEQEHTEYLKKNPNVKNEMKRLNALRKDLEDEKDEQEFNEEMLPK